VPKASSDHSERPVLRSPELTELRMFCAAAELGSFGRAAVRCNVSQPAVSKRVAALEALTATQLLERSAQGVKLTPSGRRLYAEARRVLDQAAALDDVVGGLRRVGGPVRLACSHSAADAFVGEALGTLGHNRLAVELVTANSQVIRDLVVDGRADLGVVASRPHHTPYPGGREVLLLEDEVICAVPPGHPWAHRPEPIPVKEFLRTPVVVRDPASNARWTVEAALRDEGLEAPKILVEAGTPSAARRESRERTAPVLLSRYVLAGHGFTEVKIKGLSFPRSYMFVLPAVGEPSAAVVALMDRLRETVASLPH
jgi:DNA-binding transcriptional LysR family regulator